MPGFIEFKQLSPESIKTFKTELTNSDIYDNLNKDVYADPNDNYKLLEEIITNATNKYLPTQIIQFNKCNHKKTSWITLGIIRSIKFRDKLYSKPGLKKIMIFFF